MKPQHHLLSSTIFAGVLFIFFKSWSMSAACFLSGILIDIDHIFDYIREVGLPFRVKDFVNAAYTNTKIRWTIVLHSWELMFILLLLALYTDWNPWLTGILVGFSHHIVLDTIFINEKLWTYSFYWRWKHNFEFKAIYPKLARKRTQSNLQH